MFAFTKYNFLDRSRERSATEFNVGLNSEGDWTAFPGILADLDAAIAGVSLCTRAQSWGVEYSEVASVPDDPFAQRERRGMFDAVDTVNTRRFQWGVPAIDMDDAGLPGTDAMNLSNAQIAAYVLAVTTIARSPHGNVLSVLGGENKGINN